MRHLKRSMFVFMLIAAFISLLLTAGGVPASSHTGVKSRTSNSVTNRWLTAVATVSGNASDIWAVGYSFTSSDIPQTLTEHWNGSQWSIVASPNVGIGDNYLYAVAAVSTNDVWAAGDYFSNGFFHLLLEHWNGSSWSVVTGSPIGSGNHLQGLAALSKSNVWTVGYYYNGSVFQTLIEHWNGAAWSVVTSPNVGTGNNYLMSVTALSANNIWAIGHYDNGLETPGFTLIEHWNGSSWSVVASPNIGASGSYLWGVAAVSKNNIWTVGTYYNGSAYLTLIEHWNGSSWSVVSSPNAGTGDNILYAVAADTKSDVWAVGVQGSGLTLLEHWNGTKWSIVASPN